MVAHRQLVTWSDISSYLAVVAHRQHQPEQEDQGQHRGEADQAGLWTKVNTKIELLCPVDNGGHHDRTAVSSIWLQITNGLG